MNKLMGVSSLSRSEKHELLKDKAYIWLNERYSKNIIKEFKVEIDWKNSDRLEIVFLKGGGCFIKRRWSYYLDVAIPDMRICIECGVCSKDKIRKLLELGWRVFYWRFDDNEPVECRLLDNSKDYYWV